jgi:hypothetical protein
MSVQIQRRLRLHSFRLVVSTAHLPVLQFDSRELGAVRGDWYTVRWGKVDQEGRTPFASAIFSFSRRSFSRLYSSGSKSLSLPLPA